MSAASKGNDRFIYLVFGAVGPSTMCHLHVVYFVRTITYSDCIGRVVWVIKAIVYDNYIDKELSEVEIEVSERWTRLNKNCSYQ